MTYSDQVGGFVTPGFEDVRDAFRNGLLSDSETERGASFAAYYKGELVVHLWGGYSNPETQQLWKADTLSCLFSSTKCISAIVIAHLVDRGFLDYDEKVSKYWPEFAQNDKEDITIEQLISHQAGLAATDERLSNAWIEDDPQRLCEVLEKQKPFWKPGEKHGYHTFTFGLYLDQLVRKTDAQKRSLSQYFKEEIAEPFGVDVHIGLPEQELCRVAKLVLRKKQSDGNEETSPPKEMPELLMKVYMNTSDWRAFDDMNTTASMQYKNGSVSGYSTADATAKLLSVVANSGEDQGKQLLSEEMITRFQKPLTTGADKLYGDEIPYSTGMMTFPVIEGTDEPNFMIGHTGYGGQFSAVDPKRNVSFTYITNISTPNDLEQSDLTSRRSWKLYEDLYRCIDRMENKTEHSRRTFTCVTEFRNL